MRLFSLAALGLACAAVSSEPKSALAELVSGGALVFTVVLAFEVFARGRGSA